MLKKYFGCALDIHLTRTQIAQCHCEYLVVIYQPFYDLEQEIF